MKLLRDIPARTSAFVLIVVTLVIALTSTFGQTPHPGQILAQVRMQSSNNRLFIPLIATPSWFKNVKSGDRVAQTTTLIGTYPPSVVDDLWIFVVAPNGQYYPQSFDACNQARTPKLQGQWEMRVSFGGDEDIGQPFRIILTTAIGSASQVILNTLKEWCLTDTFPGFAQLPAGIIIHEQLTVTRTAELWGPAPAISNITLPGSVLITSPLDGAQVPQEEILRGTYTSDATSDIRVLVYATNGRWYPQSYDACTGDYIHKGNGRWDVGATFGDKSSVGEPFDIVVILATPVARDALDRKQREWCANNSYPGLLTIELPLGIHEKHRIRVYRI